MMMIDRRCLALSKIDLITVKNHHDNEKFSEICRVIILFPATMILVGGKHGATANSSHLTSQNGNVDS